MKKLSLVLILVLTVAALGMGSALAQEPVELRLTWYDDDIKESTTMRALLDRFEAENPDIRVVMDIVPYADGILQQLPLQVEAGEGPDMARITQLGAMAGSYLDLRPLLEDAEYFESSFPAMFFGALRTGEDDDGLYGFPLQFTVTGPYINRTLFEQAGVEVPSDTMDAATWEDWTEACAAVAEATDTPYAIAIDRSGHRIAGPILTMGGDLLDEEGNFTIDSQGFRDFANLLFQWHEEGLAPSEAWLGAGGSYAAATDYFINAQTPCYMAGSWLISRFVTDIGDAFDWEAVPNPSGAGGSTGMPGGAALVAFNYTEHPEEVARVMEFLVQEEQYRELSENALFIPGHLNLGELDYQTDNPNAFASLNVFAAEVSKFADEAYALQFHPQNTAAFNAMRDRLTQVMTGELTLDEAIQRIQEEADAAIAAARAS